MPTRILREGILDSRAVNALSEPAEILYRRLMSVVDDYGRFESDPALIQARCFPRQADRWPLIRITQYMVELRCAPHIEDEDEAGLILDIPPLVTVYRCGQKKYMQINNFGQRVQAKPKHPGPEDEGTTVIQPLLTVDNGEKPLSRSRVEDEVGVEDVYSESKSESSRVESGRQKNSSSGFDGNSFNEIVVSIQELDAAWDRHLKHNKFQPKDVAYSQIIGMSKNLDVERFRNRHPAYCESWDAAGWQYCPLTFLEWIQADMPLAPPKPISQMSKHERLTARIGR